MLSCKVIDERDLFSSNAPSLIEVTFKGTSYDVKSFPLKASAPMVCIKLGNSMLVSLFLIPWSLFLLGIVLANIP